MERAKWMCCQEPHRVREADFDHLRAAATLPVTTMKSYKAGGENLWQTRNGGP